MCGLGEFLINTYPCQQGQYIAIVSLLSGILLGVFIPVYGDAMSGEVVNGKFCWFQLTPLP